MRSRTLWLVLAAVVTIAVIGGGSAAARRSSMPGRAAATGTPFLASLPSISTVASTVPGNGDVNPYGIVRVPASTGGLVKGDLLISNFNDRANEQGTGTTIVQISPTGQRSVFASLTASGLPGTCPGGVGLTTALSLLPGGYVVVGSLPTTNGKSATAQYGCLIVLNSHGKAISTIAGKQIAGPWDMTAASSGDITNLFVSNALNGGAAKGKHTIKNSTVLRIRLRSSAAQTPRVLNETVIANKIPWRDDPAALVIGPTGLALASDGTLYVADTLDNRIAAIPDALTRDTPAADAGATVARGGKLNQPLGLILAPNGDVIAANAGNGNMVEVTPSGQQIATRAADTKTGAGSLFGLVLNAGGTGIYYVDDGDNTLKLLH